MAVLLWPSLLCLSSSWFVATIVCGRRCYGLIDLSNLVYTPLGDVWDIVVIVNSSVNFVLYCAMSRLFRGTFWELFVAPLHVRCCAAAAADSDRTDQNGRLQPLTGTAATKIRIEGRSATSV